MEYKVKGILIDSGRVWNAPRSGHWMITPNFFEYIDKKLFYSIANKRRNCAFQKASQYINKQNLIRT